MCKEVDDEIQSMESLQCDLSIIRVATNDFSEANKLGQGGFGVVYKEIVYYNIMDDKYTIISQNYSNSLLNLDYNIFFSYMLLGYAL